MRGWIYQAARLAAAAVLVSCCLVGVRSAARADCGLHQFETLSVPVLQRADAVHGKPQYVVHFAHDNMGIPALIGFEVRFIQNCDDEPPLNNNVAIALQRLWTGAIHAGAYADAYHVVATGQTDADPRCYPYLRAAARYRVAQELGTRALGGFNVNPGSDPSVVALSRALKRTPYYAHIVALWTSAMAELGMTFPGFDHANFNYSTDYAKAANAIHEHLSDGLSCQEIANWYVLTVAPTDAPK